MRKCCVESCQSFWVSCPYGCIILVFYNWNTAADGYNYCLCDFLCWWSSCQALIASVRRTWFQKSRPWTFRLLASFHRYFSSRFSTAIGKKLLYMWFLFLLIADDMYQSLSSTYTRHWLAFWMMALLKSFAAHVNPIWFLTQLLLRTGLSLYRLDPWLEPLKLTRWCAR